MKSEGKQTEGIVFDISRYCLDDGPGIRTTVFLKGCPLRCLWCHNPESNRKEIETGFDRGKCAGCRMCVQVCPQKCHEIRNGQHYFHRESCTACGSCAGVCDFDALTQMGKQMTVGQVIKTVERDRVFYKRSGGGMTVSGGEVLYQPEFTRELLRAAKESGISTCIETSGFGDTRKLMEIAAYTDLFLYDCKLMEPEAHRKATGVGNELILQNLRELDRLGKQTILRLPIIPGINDSIEHFEKVGELADTLGHVQYLEVLPYHPLGLSKAALLGRKMPYHSTEVPKDETVEQWVLGIQKHTKKKVVRS